MAITKPVVIPSWADAGDKFPPTNEEIAIGWPFSNDPPTRQRFNWLLNYLARSARYLTQRGIADYDSEETYGLYDKCTGSNGRTYRSLADNNIGNDPTTTPAKWEQWGHSVGELMEVDAIIGLNFKNIAGWGLSTSEILQVGNAGHWHSVNLPNTTLVLPTLASMVAAGKLGSGFPIRFQYDTLVTVDPDATATDFIAPPLGAVAMTEYTFAAGEFAYIACNGTGSGGGWYILFAGMPSDRERFGTFTAHATPNSVKNITFDRAFPNNCRHVSIMPIYNNSAGVKWWLDDAPAANGFNIRCDVASITMRYHAIGD